MTKQQVLRYEEVTNALGVTANFAITNNAAENAIVAEHGERIEIIEKPEEKVLGIFVDGNLVCFVCDGQTCDLEDKGELVAYLRAN